MNSEKLKYYLSKYYPLVTLTGGVLLMLLVGIGVTSTKFNVQVCFILTALLFFLGGILIGITRSCSTLPRLSVSLLMVPLILVSLIIIIYGNVLFWIIPITAVFNTLIGVYLGDRLEDRQWGLWGVSLLIWLVFILSLNVGAVPRIISYMMLHKEFIQSPEFEFRTLDGEFLKSSDLNGKVVVLDFWATWCAPCRRQFPEIQALYDEYQSNPGVRIITVNTGQAGDSLQQVQNFLKNHRYSFPVVYDAGARVSRKLGVRKIPHTIIIDKNGRIRLRHTGYVKGSRYFFRAMKRYIDELLKE